jgi:ATP-dependent phosphofructokinase / diphosphate-dependent phosphofructokinase
VLGHVQRGGTPTPFDRVLATRFGLAAVDAAHAGQWGMMTALRSTEIELVALADAFAQLRTVPVEEYERYGVLFG